MKVFGKERNRRLMNAILLMVIGVLMAIFSAFAVDIFAYTLGTVFLVIGTFYIVCCLIGFAFFNPWLLLQGLLNLIIGSIAVSDPNAFTTWVFYIAAFFLIYQGVLEIAYSFDLKVMAVKNWWLDLAYGILMIALSVLVIALDLSKGVGANILMIVGGVGLFVSGFLEALFILLLHRTFKRKMRKDDDNDHDGKVVAEQ
ncbi:MAG TPA: hypothetical protein DCZ41_04420 [Firmicutes bacterium]|nr:hypothetical protein [Bacillota bacterium]